MSSLVHAPVREQILDSFRYRDRCQKQKGYHSRKGKFVHILHCCYHLAIERDVGEGSVVQPRASVPIHGENGGVNTNPIAAG
jgi:hypothetical protein